MIFVKKNEARRITVYFETDRTAPTLSGLVTDLCLAHLREALEDYSPSERRELLVQLRELLQ